MVKHCLSLGYLQIPVAHSHPLISQLGDTIRQYHYNNPIIPSLDLVFDVLLCEPSPFTKQQNKTNELPHDKTNKMICTPSEDSDRPGYSPSLISPLCTQWVAKDPRLLHANSKDSDQTFRPDMTEKLLTGTLSLNTTNI